MKIISKKEALSIGLRKYYTGVPCRRGHLSERFVGNGGCCQCKYDREKENPEKKKENDKKYRESHKDKIRKYQKQWVKNNSNKNAATKRRYAEKHPERVKESSKRSYHKHKEKRLAYTKGWAERNPEKRKEYSDRYKENNRERYLELKREWQMEWRKQNPAQSFIRDSLRRIFNDWNGSREDAEELLGYTFEQLVARIEFQFKDGMSWGNRREWHIDHKKPVSRFIKQGIADPKIVNALSNLQPLWAKDNLEKSDKWIFG